MAEPLSDGPALIRRMFTLIDCQSWDELGQVFDEAICYDRPGYSRLAGLAAVKHFYREVRIIASGRHQLEAVLSEGDRAACWGHFSGVSRDGKPIAIDFADSYHLSEGKVIARKSYFFVPGV